MRNHEMVRSKMSPRNLADDWRLIGKFSRRRGGKELDVKIFFEI